MSVSAGDAGVDARDATRYLSVRLPSGAECVVSLTGEDITVGKSEKNAVVVDDPAVSSTHALFRRVGEEWMVVDLASRNGVFVNHHRIAGSCILRYGDAIEIGHCHMVLRAKYPVAKPEKKDDRSSAKDKKSGKKVQKKATYIKLSGSILAKIVGPIVTVLLGLLVSGRLLASCGRPADTDDAAPAQQRIVQLHEPEAPRPTPAPPPAHVRHRSHRVR
jgi:FHA domain-containing protein